MQLVAKSLAPSKSARGSSESFLGVRAETAHLDWFMGKSTGNHGFPH